MKRIFVSETTKYIGKKVKICGWVHSKRAHGKIIFIDLRDRSGLLQVVVIPKNKELYKIVRSSKPEWVVSIEGRINKRPKGMINPDLATGKVELEPEKLEILNESRTPPIEVAGKKEAGEEMRLKYRYLDLRRERMKNNIISRHKFIKLIRDFLSEKGFLEIETPILTKSTPEGARDFLVPSRLHPGKFYALPQAPQQLKQLLMVAGLEKYFQIARCFRDEDLRGDRQPEFTQLDFEMSFVNQKEILEIIEKMLIDIVKKVFPKKKLTFKPFKVLKYNDCLKRYKTDKPDLRRNKKNPDELAFCWVINWPLFEWNKEEKRYDPMHHIFTAPQEKDIPLLDKNPLKVHSWQHDLVLNGHEVGGGSVRIHNPDIQKKVFKLVGISDKEAKEKFGHLLRAFEYGAPPHGGIALGLDRLLMILLNESSIREVMAFPKTGDGSDPMTETPSKVAPKQLKELHIKL